MNLKAFLILMSGATVVAWAGWAYVLLNVDPETSGVIGMILFYLTLFSALIGTLSIAGVFYRVTLLKRHQMVIREVKISVRHAVMLSAVCVASLALSAADLLRWWNLLAMFVTVGVIEYVFLLVQESHRS